MLQVLVLESSRIEAYVRSVTLALNVFALGTSFYEFALCLALKNALERKNYAQFFALVPDVDTSIPDRRGYVGIVRDSSG